MPAKSLLKLATEAATHNIRKIEDVGETPYHLIRPILLRLGSPEQLKNLEIASPHLVGNDEEIWLMFIGRDFPSSQTKKYRPSKPENWYQVYQKLKKEADLARAESTAALQAKLSQKAAEKESNQITLNANLKVPRRARAFGTADPKPRNPGHDMLSRARREAREATQNHSLLLPRRAPSSVTAPQGRMAGHRPTSTSTPSSPACSETAPRPDKDEAQQRRVRALALLPKVSARPALIAGTKRPVSSIFVPEKRRRT